MSYDQEELGQPENQAPLDEPLVGGLHEARIGEKLTTNDFIKAYPLISSDIFAEGVESSVGARIEHEQSLAHEVTNLDALNLDQLQDLQDRVDEIMWTAPGEQRAKRRHILFHMMILAAKLARVEEHEDHRKFYDEQEQEIEEANADLLVFALQIANLSERSLTDLYKRRVLERMARASESLE